jgi:hypothetical protein
MTLLEIVENIKAETPDAFGKVSDKVAAKIIKLGLAEINKQLAAVDEGDLKIAGLWNFKIKNITQENNGVKTFVKKVTLRIRAVNEAEDI